MEQPEFPDNQRIPTSRRAASSSGTRLAPASLEHDAHISEGSDIGTVSNGGGKRERQGRTARQWKESFANVVGVGLRIQRAASYTPPVLHFGADVRQL